MMLQTQSNERYLQIKALEHLIDAEFDPQKSCHAVCHLVSELLTNSDDDLSRMVAGLAQKALESSVDSVN